MLVAVCKGCKTCPLGGMVNTSPSQGEDYGFDPRSGYQEKYQGIVLWYYSFFYYIIFEGCDKNDNY